MKLSIFLLSFLFMQIVSFGQQINSTVKRDTLYSDLLNDNREISVYLPPSYFSTNQNFPVLYILDGDYNFHYVSGLLELQSSISENIPEIILVGISGKGSETYRNNCKPNIDGVEDKGNADQYSDFIEKELVPYVNKKYKTANFNILAGHSVGGLFVINTAINKPKLFNEYIAISPALWWENNAINKVARKAFETNPSYSTNAYVSLANEEEMGVDEFLAIVNDYYPSKSVFEFKHFPNENHNSVGLPTYVWALNDIFSTWKGEKEYFNASTELKAHNESVLKKYGHSFNIQNGLLGYTVYTLQDNPEELKRIQSELKIMYPNAVAKFNNLWAGRLIIKDKKSEAEKLLNETIKEYPEFFENYNSLAKLKLENKEFETADSLINQGIILAQTQKARQWQLNELIETKEKIKAANIVYKK